MYLPWLRRVVRRLLTTDGSLNRRGAALWFEAADVLYLPE